MQEATTALNSCVRGIHLLSKRLDTYISDICTKISYYDLFRTFYLVKNAWIYKTLIYGTHFLKWWPEQEP